MSEADEKIAALERECAASMVTIADLRAELEAAEPIQYSPRIHRSLRSKRVILWLLKRLDDGLWHDAWYGALSGCVTSYARAAAKRALKGNCTFIDDDIFMLEHLAQRAVDAGLIDQLHPSIQAKLAPPAAGTTEPVVGNGSSVQEPDDGNGRPPALSPDTPEKT
jgi:hypothetical protein